MSQWPQQSLPRTWQASSSASSWRLITGGVDESWGFPGGRITHPQSSNARGSTRPSIIVQEAHAGALGPVGRLS